LLSSLCESQIFCTLSTTRLNHGAAVAITTTVVLTVLVAVCTAVTVTVAVFVNEMVVELVTIEVAGADGLVMKQLHAELMRVAGTVARYVGVTPVYSRFALAGPEVH
jgi:hypothetical protein